jgi:ADP-heptose:LPS heptosyltransferase/transcription elongation factor Elf1
MRDTFLKLIPWDFWQLLSSKEGTKFSIKLWYLFNEILSRILKWIIRGLFFPKLKDSKNRLRKIAKKYGFEEVFCSFCGSEKYEVMWEKKGFRIVKCSNCGLQFVTPRFNQEGRKLFFYSKYHFAGYSLFGLFNKLDLAINEGFSVDEILDCIHIYKKTGDLIEIGPLGKGLTKKAEKQGFKCWRLKTNDWSYESPFEEREYRTDNGCSSVKNKKFDVVSCLDILDRMLDPMDELKDIHRILKNDGILLIRVPNFGSKIAERSGIAWHYNRPWEKIYQWDYKSLNELLEKSGFKTVDLKTELSDGVGFPGCMITVGRKKNLKTKKKNTRILVIRQGALGDVLLATPIIRELKQKFHDSHLIFKTNYPEILENNPHVDKVIKSELKDDVDVVFNLMYELYPDIPIVEAYGKITQLRIEYPEIEFYLSPEEKKEINEYMKTLSIEDLKGLVVIHPMSGNRIKKWNGNSYQTVSDYICSRNLRVVTVGSPIDCVELKGAINLIGKLSLRQSAALISKAKLFMGLDSYPMHIADAFKIPSVILFGSTDPRKVLMNGHTVKTVQSSEHCLGCRHDTTPDRWKQNVDCRRGRLYCMESISSDRVIEEIDGILKSWREK